MFSYKWSWLTVADLSISVVFFSQGTLIIIGGIYFNVVLSGALYRPASYYKQRRRSRLQSAEADKLIDENDGDNMKMPVRKHVSSNNENNPEIKVTVEEKNGENSPTHNSRSRNQSKDNKDTVVFGSVDSLHTIAFETDNHKELPNVENVSEEKKSNRNKCLNFLSSLIDFSVLKSYIVILLTVCSFLLFFGQFNFILFMPSTAESKGYSKYDKAYLVSISGICDLVGRILVGVAGDLHLVARYKILATVSFINGFAILGFGFSTDYWTLALFVGLYGFLGGCYVAINAPVVIDMVGIAALPKVLGVVLLIQGLGAAIGQPILGKAYMVW